MNFERGEQVTLLPCQFNKKSYYTNKLITRAPSDFNDVFQTTESIYKNAKKSSIISFDGQGRAFSKQSDTSEYTHLSRDAHLDVNHIFHDSCLKDWLLKNGMCPICNIDVSSESFLDKDKQEDQGDFTEIANKLTL